MPRTVRSDMRRELDRARNNVSMLASHLQRIDEVYGNDEFPQYKQALELLKELVAHLDKGLEDLRAAV